MTSAESSAAQFDPSLVEPKGRPLRKLLAPFAIGLALLTSLLTFAVLTGLTQIEPTREIANYFVLMNAATILVLVGIISGEAWQVMQARRRGRAAARRWESPRSATTDRPRPRRRDCRSRAGCCRPR